MDSWKPLTLYYILADNCQAIHILGLSFRCVKKILQDRPATCVRFEAKEESELLSNRSMPKFLIGRIVVISLFSLVFYFGVAGLRSGQIRSRGYTFKRDENPFGYWFTVLTSLVGPLAIIYLMLTR